MSDYQSEMQALQQEAFRNDGRVHDYELISLCEKIYAGRDYDEAMQLNREWEN
jgi:hypothetical protein